MAAVYARSQPSTRSTSKHGGGLGPISRAVTRPEAERATARSRQARAARRARREPPRGGRSSSTQRRVTGADAAPRLWRAWIGHLDFFSLCTEHSTSSSLRRGGCRVWRNLEPGAHGRRPCELVAGVRRRGGILCQRRRASGRLCRRAALRFHLRLREHVLDGRAEGPERRSVRRHAMPGGPVLRPPVGSLRARALSGRADVHLGHEPVRRHELHLRIALRVARRPGGMRADDGGGRRNAVRTLELRARNGLLQRELRDLHASGRSVHAASLRVTKAQRRCADPERSKRSAHTSRL